MQAGMIARISSAAWVAVAIAVSTRAAEQTAPLSQARKLAISTTRTDRIKALRVLKQLAKPGTTGGDEATFRYAELCLRFHEDGEKSALAEARRAFSNLQKNAGSRWGLRGKIGLFRVMATEGKRAEAVKQLDRFLGKQTKCERAVEAAYYLGCIYAQKQNDLAELKNAQRALSYASQLHKSVSKYHKPLVSARAISGKLAGVKKRIWELQAGRLKVLFAKAEKLRKTKKYDAAMAIYRQIRKEFPGHDLTELSGVRIAQCHFGKKQLKKAVIEAREFVALDPLGAYRGHAHLLIGDINLEHYFNVAGCEPEFRCILDPTKKRPTWVDPERRKLISYRKLDPKKTPPATEVHETWKEALHSAHERVGILEYLRRNYKQAIEHFETSQELKPTKTYGNNPHQGMAELADRIRRKQEFIPALVLAERAERPKLVLLLASLYMEGWRDDRAMNLLQRVAGGEFKAASLNQKAYAHVKLAEGLFYERKDKEAIKILRKFEKKPYYRTPYAARALLQLAVAVNRDGKMEDGLNYLDKCHARDPNSEWGKMALYQKAYAMYASDKSEAALRLFREFAARYPNSFPVKKGHVQAFIEELLAERTPKKKEL